MSGRARLRANTHKRSVHERFCLDSTLSFFQCVSLDFLVGTTKLKPFAYFKSLWIQKWRCFLNDSSRNLFYANCTLFFFWLLSLLCRILSFVSLLLCFCRVLFVASISHLVLLAFVSSHQLHTLYARVRPIFPYFCFGSRVFSKRSYPFCAFCSPFWNWFSTRNNSLN